MRTIVLDIETAPDIAPDMEEWLCNKKHSKIQAPANYKDPEKIEQYVKDKAEGIIGDIYDKAPFRATTGKIVCLGLCVDGESTPYARDEERYLLGGFWNYFLEKEHPRLVTFNGMAFDLPFCIQRSLLLGVNVPPGVQNIYLNRYDKGKIHFDIMKEWTCGVYGEYISLHELCLAFGIEPPVGDGADVPRLYEEGDIEAIIKHNKSDLIATWEVYQRMEGYKYVYREEAANG